MKPSKHLIEVQAEEHIGPLEVQPVDDAVRLTLLLHEMEESCEVVVVISDDAALRDLNRRFRGIDQLTDVLAFSNETRGPFTGAGQFPRYLGDIVISLDRAREQAEAVGGPLEQELQVLAVHGTLHLLGYDHDTPEHKARMWSIQAQILEHLHVDIALPE